MLPMFCGERSFGSTSDRLVVVYIALGGWRRCFGEYWWGYGVGNKFRLGADRVWNAVKHAD